MSKEIRKTKQHAGGESCILHNNLEKQRRFASDMQGVFYLVGGVPMRYPELLEHTDTVNELLARYGVKFGIYKNNVFREQLFPFDAIPRIIEKEEFAYLEKGLKQRVVALNYFLKDIYSKKQIVKDGVIPEDFIFASSGYMAECEGVTPAKGIYSHISGIDLVKGKDGKWYILEDNLRVPSGASYPMIARDISRKASPDTFTGLKIEDNRNYAKLLRRTFDHVNAGGHTVILTPGRYNAAYFEHSYLAEQTGAHLVNGSELIVKDDRLYFVTADGKYERVGAVYRRISDEYLDPMNFNPESLIGIPHIYDVFRKGNVALLNAPGNGVADDNAIVLRESIGSETLAYIQLAIYEMNKAAQSRAPMIELQKVNDNLLAFYGTVFYQCDIYIICRNSLKCHDCTGTGSFGNFCLLRSGNIHDDSAF